MNRDDCPEPDVLELAPPAAEAAELLRQAPASELEPIPVFAWAQFFQSFRKAA